VPVRKDDEIQVARGTYKVSAETGEASPDGEALASISVCGGAPARRHVSALRASRHWSS